MPEQTITVQDAYDRMQNGEELNIHLYHEQINLSARDTSPVLRCLVAIYNTKRQPRIIGITRFAKGFHLEIQGHPGAFLVHASYKITEETEPDE
ncbi:hypothetical protein G4Y79_15380 [Phototrophicus methaneseepsis]|uniref:Uncharacterized protein n=1 Tax=Phototrophicus methaneseepsis TaxID=2710758 RepID=A0A7S8E673_9CHLR|nr:hypothetical protein [Phototrophicus methaneseepsis]QPC81085.1 hypothetical protein G4Y79_15380 [Phototrophicus methaneseepsis]